MLERFLEQHLESYYSQCLLTLFIEWKQGTMYPMNIELSSFM